MSYFEEDFDEEYEEYCRRYEEEECYEEPSCSTLGRFIMDDGDYLFFPSYDEYRWHQATRIHGQMFSGGNSKEPF